MKWLAVLAVLMPAFAWASVSGIDDVDPNIPPEMQAKLDSTILTYYLAPSVEKVNTVLDIMNDSKVLRKKTAWAPMIGFLTVVFADNKNHVMSWMSRNDYNGHAQDVFIAALMHAKLSESAFLFAQAHQWKKKDLDKLHAYQDKTDLKKLPIILPGHIDTLWGAFFASGDSVYVGEIVEALFMTALPASDTVEVPPQYDMVAENKKLAESTLRQYAAGHKAVRDILAKHIAEEKDEAKKKVLIKLMPPQG